MLGARKVTRSHQMTPYANWDECTSYTHVLTLGVDEVQLLTSAIKVKPTLDNFTKKYIMTKYLHQHW